MNTLHYGDNLPILRSMPSKSVDLVYLDPPFNSSRSYNLLFKDQSGATSDAQITAFDDTWAWGPAAEQTLLDIIQANPGVVDDLLDALKKVIGPTPLLAYLVMIAARLLELHRLLKPTGSLYLHCDPTASHYLKMILDTVFGFENFQNEIIWRRTRAHNDAKITKFGAIHDVILYYSKGSNRLFNIRYYKKDENAPQTHDLYKYTDGKLYRKGDCRAPGGRGPKYEWNGHVQNWRFTQEQAKQLETEGKIVYSASGMPRILRPVDPSKGSPIQDLWIDIDSPNSGSGELLGYPTQKPLALLERIIQASSNPGDVVLDPFCGCGTAIAAAEKLGRQWIGIDITYLAITLIEGRMKKMYPGIQFEVRGKPADLASARDLFHRDPYQFQWWALSLIGAKPISPPSLQGGSQGVGKKGKDRGIDGIINYIDSVKQDLKRVIVQVKGGHVGPTTVRDLVGVLTNEKAEIGVLITLEPPTKEMAVAAAAAGYYKSEFWNKSYPKLQILTIEQLLAGATVQMPPETGTFIAAQKVKKVQGSQTNLDI